MTDKQQLWQAVLGELELLLSKANFTTWFKQTEIASIEEESITIRVPNEFTKTWLEKKYHSEILKTLRRLTDERVGKIIYKIEQIGARVSSPSAIATEESVQSTKKEVAASQGTVMQNGINPKYVFSSFVVGKNNELAHAACIAVANAPGKSYNPLFLYGGVGLGKTHLLQAIGNQLINERKMRLEEILYVPCETFTNDFVQSVREGRANEFKNVYRAVSVLIIDDVQFLTGKEGTQEEFFHTFNALYQADKQIILSSDRPPKAIPALEHRLLSRFEWGMIADIGAPDYETRLAILHMKCQERGYTIPEDALKYLATIIQNNIRELEGALNRLIASHELNQEPITIESTKQLLSSFTTTSKRNSITPKQLIQTVAEFFDIDMSALLGSSRKKELVIPRQITMYLLREDLQSSYPSIGHELGGRDHTTAIHACVKIEKEIANNEKIRQDITLLRQRMYSRS